LRKIAAQIKQNASRVSLAFASNCPDAALFPGLAGTLILHPAGSAERRSTPHA
jgi:hypothetical protein